MKHLKKFSESKDSDRVYDILSSSIEEIRNVFIDFEDSNNIKYNLSTLISSFTPKSTVIDDYIRSAISEYNIFNKVKRDEIIFKCEVTLSYKLNNIDLNDYSKDKYDDLIVCHKRLESMGYVCSTTLEKYLPQYAKCIVRVTIPIKD